MTFLFYIFIEHGICQKTKKVKIHESVLFVENVEKVPKMHASTIIKIKYTFKTIITTHTKKSGF